MLPDSRGSAAVAPVAVRELKYAEALREGLDICMERDPRVYVMGLGVPDPKGIFGTTTGLLAKYGDRRVMDMPIAENGMTGVAIGSALVGMRPVITHQRIDFALLSMEQIVNQAAKWHYMFGGQASVPMVIRLLVGRGWGQGPQHSQSLQSWFAHIPGLRVVMPATAHDAKGLLISSIEDNNPVIFIEHRWLHNISGPVPEGHYRVPLGTARVIREGTDVTLVGVSYMTLESLRAAEALETVGISAEVIDVRSLSPLDMATIVDSVRKTRRVVIADTGWVEFGVSSEISARVVEQCFERLLKPPYRIGLPSCPTPTAPSLAEHFYPVSSDIVSATCRLFDREPPEGVRSQPGVPLDVPDPTFTGPF